MATSGGANDLGQPRLIPTLLPTGTVSILWSLCVEMTALWFSFSHALFAVSNLRYLKGEHANLLGATSQSFPAGMMRVHGWIFHHALDI